MYCKFWNKSRKKYGLEQYDEDLINLVSKNIPKRNRILDVGIGDGYPFASQLNNIGYQLYGIDLSPTHVAMVRKEFPNIIVDVGDAQSLKFPNKYFDGVYCFRSTWYIPDLELSIKEMIRVLKDGGFLIFDIQNLRHPMFARNVKKLLKRNSYHYMLEYFFRISKNMIKLLLRPIKYYQCDWNIKKHVVISSSPTDPNDLHSFFNMRKDLQYKIYGVEFDNPYTLVEIGKTNLTEFHRLVYKVFKKGKN